MLKIYFKWAVVLNFLNFQLQIHKCELTKKIYPFIMNAIFKKNTDFPPYIGHFQWRFNGVSQILTGFGYFADKKPELGKYWKSHLETF